MALLVGCATMKGGSNLPSEHQLVTPQMTLHADVPLPRQHPLIDELVRLKPEMEQTLGLSLLDQPVEVYLFSRDKQFRRYLARTYPGLPDRRAFFVKADGRLIILALSGPKISEDLRHELAHACLHGTFSEIPLWLDEGLAEYFEINPRHRGFHRAHVKLLAAAFRQQQWTPSLRRLESLASPLDLGQMEYAESWLWVHWALHQNADRRAMLLTTSVDESGAAHSTQPALFLNGSGASGNQSADVIRHLKRLAEQL